MTADKIVTVMRAHGVRPGPVEIFAVILFRDGQPFLVEEIARGTSNSVFVWIANVFRSAFLRKATEMVIVHTHPQGSIPSRADRKLTRILRREGKLRNIEILDHIVIGQGEYTSIRATSWYW